MTVYEQQAKEGKLWCYDCKNYYSGSFCGLRTCNCQIYGSLDLDQHIYHPDKAADSCKDYTPNGKPRWFEKYKED